MPSTSCPASSINAAAADESTPPLMATTTRIVLWGPMSARGPWLQALRPGPAPERLPESGLGVAPGVLQYRFQQPPGGFAHRGGRPHAQLLHHFPAAQGELAHAQRWARGQHALDVGAHLGCG